MGQTLSEPITTKKTSTFENSFCKVASSSMQGWRISMEDAHTVQMSIDGDATHNFFGVYDGHGGTQSALYTQEHLHSKLNTQPAFKTGDYKEALIKAFLDLDREMLEDRSGKFSTSGCTAVTLLTKSNTLYCANCGDSRAVLSERGQAVPLSYDHKPSNEEELRRIRAAGGFVEFNRVNGTLALSRALGDFEFKSATRPPKDQMVTAVPEVSATPLNDNHEFVILACDGIWDVMSSQEVIDFVRPKIATGQGLDTICESLLTRCLAPVTGAGGMGCDNMTVTIISLLQGNGWGRLVEKCNRPLI